MTRSLDELWAADAHEPLLVAEISGNHLGDRGRARDLITTAVEHGADAVKLQTYTADTLTLAIDNEWFRLTEGPWAGRTLYDLYKEAHTPWEWQAELFAHAADLGVPCFSTPFDPSAVDFLEAFAPPAYKIASFEVVDIPLLRRVARTGRSVIMSTGRAELAEVDEAVRTLSEYGCPRVALLICVSAYPARPSDFRLRNLDVLATRYTCPVGLSDHSLDPAIAIAAVARGARLVEKHFILSRSDGGPDAGHSIEPSELQRLADVLDDVHLACRYPARFGPAEPERASLAYRKSIFVVRDVPRGAVITAADVRVVRPGHGALPRYLDRVIGARAMRDLDAGTPLRLADVEG